MQELGLREPEVEGTAISLNVRNYPPHDTALYPIRLEYFVLNLFATFDKEVRRGEAKLIACLQVSALNVSASVQLRMTFQ